MEKEERIKKEVNRLKKIYRKLEGDRKDTAQGLIQRAAYMRVTLEDFEADLDINGFTEPFCQSEKQGAYDRKRPIADLYTSMSANYQKCIKQLTELLPKEKQDNKESTDGFDDFINGREDI